MSHNLEQRTHVETVLATTVNATVNARAAIHDGFARSWQRCIRDHGLDPARSEPTRILTEQRLREHTDKIADLLDAAHVGIEQLYGHIASHDYVLLLCDGNGIVVDQLGNPNDKRALRQSGLTLGADWSERHAGTCGVGTCIAEKRALICHRANHFNVNHINLSCTSVPILAPDGSMLAALNVGALRSPPDKNSQNFSLELLRLYACMIEDSYFLQHYRANHIVRISRSPEQLQMHGSCLLAMEANGDIIAANTSARTLLPGCLPKNIDAPDGALNISHLFDCTTDDVLGIPLSTNNHITTIDSHAGNTCFATIIEPHHSDARHPAPTANGTEDVPALDRLTGGDTAMDTTLACAKRLRDEPINILIVGETGTGKELLARALHETSHRANKPFVAVNCAAIPESLIESELFGYRPGTFTGARSEGKKGLIRQSDGGTLFLDEIGDMPYQLQTRLLRVLAEKEVFPLGSERAVSVDLRVVSATHRDIRRLLGDNSFREDLYYRLDGATLRLPPLRARQDLEYIVRQVFDTIRAERHTLLSIRQDAMHALLAHPWPGNVRELHNALQFAVATCSGGIVTRDDLPDACTSASAAAASSEPTSNCVRQPPATTDLNRLLRQHKWNITVVSKVLGVSRPTVYRRMRKQGIVQPHLQ